MSREIPIIFNSDMVRAILAGQKTQTRRPVKAQPHGVGSWVKHGDKFAFPNVNPYCSARCPFGQTGDLLWVRETFAVVPRTAYRTSDGVQQVLRPDDDHDAAIFREGWERSHGGLRWRPSIHMPRWASRILLRVTSVRVERVQHIDDAAAIAEGVGSGHYIEDGWYWKDWRLSDEEAAVSPMLGSARESFLSLWESIYGNWDANPWVWVIEFERVTDSKKREAA